MSRLKCQICACELKKKEARFVDEESFAFLENPPAGISIGAYCNPCFDEKVQAELDRYNNQVEQAKDVNVFYLSQSRESRFVRRIEKPVQVKDCADRDEVILRLAFLAIQSGNNAIVDVDLSSQKIINGRWQTSSWSGRAIPAHIDPAALERRFMGAPN
jgi:hypothetical protein